MDGLWSESAPRGGTSRADWRPAIVFGQAMAYLRRTLDRERSRWFLWSAVLFASGIATYFQLPAEPPLWAVGLITLIALLLGFSAARPGGSKIAIAFSLVLAGLAVGKLRTETGGPGALPLPLGVVQVEAWLERVELRPGGKGFRFYLRPTAIEGAEARHLPRLLLLTWRGKPGKKRIRPGDFLQMRVRFLDPLEPAWPGGYDPQFVRWFQGIGASGFLLGPPENKVSAAPPPGFVARASQVERVREEIGARLRAALPGRAGAVATALIIGDRTAIPEEDRDNLRGAGLAHLLAISGLHMALFAGGVFWLIRAALALSPALAAGWPIKKIAACLALGAAAGYLMISGSGLATQRAFVMVAIMFLAILCGRPALSMRNIALAAFAILLFRPESLMSVSFQLSFMAVIGLVALFEAYDAWRTRRGAVGSSDGRAVWLAKKGIDYLLRVSATTIVAGLATAPIAAFHFNKVAAFSLLGNLIAIPVVGTFIMPAAILGLIAMPFGLEAWPLVITGAGIELVLETARFVSSLPGAVRLVPAAPDVAGLIMALGILWICLWKTFWRLAGAGLLALGIGFGALADLPDLLVAPGGKQVALKTQDNKLAFSSARASRYAAERWLLKFADTASLSDAAKRKGFSCDRYGCTGRLRNGLEVAVVRHPSILAEECRRAAIVITSFEVRHPCLSAAELLTPKRLRARGVHAFYVQDRGGSKEAVAVTGRTHRGARPWNAAPERLRRKPTLQRKKQEQRPKPQLPKQPPGPPVNSTPPLQVRI